MLVVITSVDPDGTAVVHVVIDRPFPEKDFASKLAGGLLTAARNSVILVSARKSWEEQNRYKEFDARFTRDGALLVAVEILLSLSSPATNTPPQSAAALSPKAL